MSNLSDAVQTILYDNVIWVDYFETSLDKRSLAADIIRAAALYCKQDKLILLSIADELDNF